MIAPTNSNAHTAPSAEFVSPDGSGGIEHNFGALTAETTLELSYYARADDIYDTVGNPYVFIVHFQDSGGDGFSACDVAKLATAWTEYTCSLVVSPGARQTTLWFVWQGGSGVMLDDVVVTGVLAAPTSTPTATNTPLPTNTPTELPTSTATPTDLPTNTPTATSLPTELPTNTPTATSLPTELPTSTLVPPTPTDQTTSTPTNTPTATEVPSATPFRSNRYTCYIPYLDAGAARATGSKLGRRAATDDSTAFQRHGTAYFVRSIGVVAAWLDSLSAAWPRITFRRWVY